MNITIISVGKLKNKQIETLFYEYIKTISPYSKIKSLEIKDATKDEEEDKMKQIISKFKNPFVFVLSEEGKTHSSIKFSKIIHTLTKEDKEIVFCIGGANGFNKPISFGDEILSLSKMTFTHEMGRLFLAEQIYRAITIIHHKTYHRE